MAAPLMVCRRGWPWPTVVPRLDPSVVAGRHMCGTASVRSCQSGTTPGSIACSGTCGTAPLVPQDDGRGPTCGSRESAFTCGG